MWHLILTQGVLCAIGNGLVFSPTTLYLDQWFIQRKGLAYGIMWAAKSICGVALPFVASACLGKFGARTTLRAWTVTTVSPYMGNIEDQLTCCCSYSRRLWRCRSSSPESHRLLQPR